MHRLREVVWDQSAVSALRNNLPDEAFEEVLEALETGRDWRGEELFYPLAFESRTTLQDYLSDRSATVFLDIERLEVAEGNMRKEYDELYTRAVDQGMAIPSPDTLTADLSSFIESRKRRLVIRTLRNEGESGIYHIPCEPGRSFF